MSKRFKARLTSRGRGGAWTFLPIPFDVRTAFGGKALGMVIAKPHVR